MKLRCFYNIFALFTTTGKTLILEAAAKTLSERDDTEVVFISALGISVISVEITIFAFFRLSQK